MYKQLFKALKFRKHAIKSLNAFFRHMDNGGDGTSFDIDISFNGKKLKMEMCPEAYDLLMELVDKNIERIKECEG